MEKSPGTPRPSAKDIAADIRRDIVEGVLLPGKQLDAARDVAKQYGVTLVKVQNAYRMLSDEGLVYSQQGRGTFVLDPANPPEDATRDNSAYALLLAQISTMHEAIRQLGERLEHLERIVNADQPTPPQ